MRLLTKSRFKLGLECPNKLFYTNNKEFANNKLDDPFLVALANGGFQVEALARATYPSGYFVSAAHFEYEKAIIETNIQLNLNDSVVFEAAFGFGNLFVRTDIVEKKGNKVRLIEVKAKSFDSSDENCFIGKKGGVVASWKMYLFDLAFQKYVAQLNYPEFQFEAYLYLADKNKQATVNGLNQMFRVLKDGDPRKDVVGNDLNIEQLQETNVLSEVNVDDIINDIISGKYSLLNGYSFKETVDFLSEKYKNNEYVNWPVNYSACKSCEFKASEQDKKDGLKCGFTNCFQKQKGWTASDFNKPKIFEIWNFRSASKFAEKEKWFMEDFNIEDFKTGSDTDKLAVGDRQWLQVSKENEKDNSIYVEKDGLKDAMNQWVYPLHFIDFETSGVALPFTNGRYPYEQVAFQFSHHKVNEDGTIEHHSEYINNVAGEFPNFEFVRALKNSLDKDQGTIFRFSFHENSILNTILNQLETSSELDRQELILFIKSITVSTNNQANKWCGPRAMIDLCQIVKDYYYNPLTKGSNSIKYVLPAVLQKSQFLQNKYSKSSNDIGVSSLNFGNNHIWLQKEGDDVLSPYKMLPPLFEGWTEFEKNETLSDLDDIANGGAALTAYAKLQYVDMTENERNEITKALLKYCELDTLAMVMIFEHLKYECI